MKSPSRRSTTSRSNHRISRRQFLQTVGAAAGAGVLAGCGLANLQPTPAGTNALLPGTSIPFTGPRPKVAITRAETYDRALIRRQVQELFENIGGLDDIISRGDKVVMKINLTGGIAYQFVGGKTATEYHVLHPEVVRAAAELLRDAGAKELYIVEAVWDLQSFPFWGYTEMAKTLNATLVDLNRTEPYSDFATVPVGANWSIYENFKLNRILEEADAFVSIAKLKAHCTAGVTFSMKNLVGCAPLKYYTLPDQENNRSAFHGTETGHNTRLPRVIVDLNQARPIHLALIDGVITCEGGEGPWNEQTDKVRPGVMVAGKNALATDAVCTAVMGFDPTTEAPAEPFLQSDNHLNLAYQLGLGTNRIDEIDMVGTVPSEFTVPVGACRNW